MDGRERILVIKFSALGDIVQAFAAFEQIRRAHMDAEITLLTTPPYADLVRESGLFDRIETDGKPDDIRGLIALARRLRAAGYVRVYDLQTSGRSSRYRLLFLPRFPEWSGIALGASHRQTRLDRETMHNLDRIADQLHVAGIGPAYEPGQAPAPNLIWAARRARGEDRAIAPRFGVKRPFALLIPGASPGRPAKFWPIGEYRSLARTLAARGMTVVVAGAEAERHLGVAIAEVAPGVVDLTGRTRMIDLAALGAECALCVTNDTGPGHMAAYAGAPGLMLMSKISSPRHYAPRAKMRTLQVDDLAELTAAQVTRELGALIPGAKA
jgi:ADP-heptose:LPS heptosyltransferase